MSTSASHADRVVIFDTTLRDGEQSPGATMTHEEKLEVAELLDQMGIDIIEAGFPIASVGDFEAVNEIAKRTRNSVVCGLARAGLIASAARAHPHVHLDLPGPYEMEAPDGAGEGLCHGGVLGDAGAQLHR